MKGILFFIFWVMIYYAVWHWLGFWGVFGVTLLLVFSNYLTWDSQMKKIEEMKKNQQR